MAHVLWSHSEIIIIYQGYTFEAEANGRTFTVTVPQGGVKEGAKFTVPYPSDQGYLSTVTASTNIPVGAWRVSAYYI